MSNHPVVVTGMGAVSAFGWGVDALDSVFSGRSAIDMGCDSALPGAPLALAARLKENVPPGSFDLRVSDSDRVTQMAVFAAHEAIQMTGINPLDIGLVTWGSAYGGASSAEEAYTRLLFNQTTLKEAVSPFTVTRSMLNASAAGVAASVRLTCPVITYSCACASSAVAIGEAMQAIATGRCEVALVGGSEALIVPGVIKAWEALGALARPDMMARWHGPFDSLRNGMMLGEGAACLVLESISHAASRHSKVLAHVRGYGHVNDPDCVTQPNSWPQLRAIMTALRNARTEAAQISYVNANATGTRIGDATEINALNELFGASDAVISSTKGSTGHLLGAAGALEAVISILALRTGRCPPNVELHNPDERIRFKAPSSPEPLDARGLCLTNSFAFGGTNVALVFGV